MLLDDGKKLKARKVIIATGGISYPLTGSTGDGQKFAENVGHSIIPLKPALVPLEIRQKYVKELQGLTLKNVRVMIYCENKKVDSEFGEMIFTHFGVSGPIILKISGKIMELLEENKKVSLSLNLKPALDKEMIDKRLIREFKNHGLKTLKNVLKGLFPAG